MPDREGVPAEVQLYVQRQIEQTRHALRNELVAAVGRIELTQRESMQQATEEHGQVRKDIARLRDAVVELRTTDATQAARDDQGKNINAKIIAYAALVLGVSSPFINHWLGG